MTTPGMLMEGYNKVSLANYIQDISGPNVNSESLVASYTSSQSAINLAYIGGIYSPM